MAGGRGSFIAEQRPKIEADAAPHQILLQIGDISVLCLVQQSDIGGQFFQPPLHEGQPFQQRLRFCR